MNHELQSQINSFIQLYNFLSFESKEAVQINGQRVKMVIDTGNSRNFIVLVMLPVIGKLVLRGIFSHFLTYQVSIIALVNPMIY